MSTKRKKIIFIIILTTIFFIMYNLNSKTALSLDDYPYHFTFSRMPNENTKRITNPIQIIPSMVTHWKTWGGRVVNHSLLQFTFMLGIKFFNIINSIFFILYIILIYKYINSKDKYNIPLLLCILSFVILFVPTPNYTIMWKSGSANYLWPSILILCMAIIYKKHFDNENDIKDNTKNTILLFLFGLVAGCTNENVGCSLILLEFIYMIGYKCKYKKIPKWAFSTITSTTIGYLLLIMAPGNYNRIEILDLKANLTISKIFNNFFFLTKSCIEELFHTFLLLIIVIILIPNRKKFVI